jgi:hypothetical protein
MPKSTTTPPRETKAAILRKLLTRKAGADLAALQSATGWQGIVKLSAVLATMAVRCILPELALRGQSCRQSKLIIYQN